MHLTLASSSGRILETIPGATGLRGVAFVAGESGAADVLVVAEGGPESPTIRYFTQEVEAKKGTFRRTPGIEATLRAMLPADASAALAKRAWRANRILEASGCDGADSLLLGLTDDGHQLVAEREDDSVRIGLKSNGRLPKWWTSQVRAALGAYTPHCDGGWDRFGAPGCSCLDPFQTSARVISAATKGSDHLRQPPALLPIPTGGLAIETDAGRFRLPQLASCQGRGFAATMAVKRGVAVLLGTHEGPSGFSAADLERECRVEMWAAASEKKDSPQLTEEECNQDPACSSRHTDEGSEAPRIQVLILEVQ
ncbi:MAG: hypothetical protein QM765_17610 [Myxococcales bacterium]